MRGLTRTMMAVVLAAVTMLFSVVSFAGEDVEVSESDARLHAVFAFIDHVSSDLPMLEEWYDASLGQGTLLYDPIGDPSVWEFDVVLHGERTGRINVAATSIWGSTALSLISGARTYSIEEGVSEAVSIVHEMYPNCPLVNAVPVVYQSMRVAAMVDVYDRRARTTRRVFLSLPDMLPLDYARDPEAAPGVPVITSSLEPLMDSSDERREMYAEEMEVVVMTVMSLIDAHIDVSLYEPLNSVQWDDARIVISDAGWTQDELRTVNVSNCKLIKQLESDWCARAVAQMINWYHYQTLFHTQAQVDALMNAYGWDKDFEPAMKKYFTKNLSMTYSAYDPDTVITNLNDPIKQEAVFENIRKQIKEGWPFCDGVPFHARMGMAYRIHAHNDYITQYEVGIYDPEPNNGGIGWELGWKTTSFGFSPVALRYYLLNIRQVP